MAYGAQLDILPYSSVIRSEIQTDVSHNRRESLKDE